MFCNLYGNSVAVGEKLMSPRRKLFLCQYPSKEWLVIPDKKIYMLMV